MQIRSKRQSLPWRACTLNRRGELRVAAETGKKRGDLPVTCGTLGARNGVSSLDSQGSNVSCEPWCQFPRKGAAVGPGEVSINLCNLVYNLNKTSTGSFKTRCNCQLQSVTAPRKQSSSSNFLSATIRLLGCHLFFYTLPWVFPILTHPELITC